LTRRFTMLVSLDDSPWHQISTTFDHVGTSDVRFFDRLWFSGAQPGSGRTLQFTLGVYQNMNVVDGGFVVIHEGKQHNLRASRQLRPTYETSCGPLEISVLEPLAKVRLRIAPNEGGISGDLEFTATFDAIEERHHFGRSLGRVTEDYSRYDQIGELNGSIQVDDDTLVVDSWWACRDHSWGVRRGVGIPEPFTGTLPQTSGSLFAFLFFSTETHGGHVQVTSNADIQHLTSEVVERTSGVASVGANVALDAEFVDEERPRRFTHVHLEVTDERGDIVQYEINSVGASVAMKGLGYGGFADGLGLGVYRGVQHREHDVWDVVHAAEVRLANGETDRPVHRIQPVEVTRISSDGTSQGMGSLTLIAEQPLDADGHVRARF
jgi:hypothetical protein